MSLIYDGKTIKDVRFGDDSINRVYCVWARPAAPTEEKLIITCNLDLMVEKAVNAGGGLVYADSSFVEDGQTHYVFNIKGAKDSFLINKTSPINALRFIAMPKGTFRSFGNCFQGCSGLTSLDVSGFDTSAVWNLGGLFYGCSGLTSLDVSGFNTSSATTMGNMFYSCSGLTSLDVSGFNTSNCTNFASMFRDCSGLTSLDVSGFDTSKSTNFSMMFSGCRGLTSLDVSGFDTSKCTNFEGMFSGCRGLTSLDVSGFDTSKCTSIYAMFSDCQGLLSLDLSGLDTSAATTIGNAFASCFALHTIKLGRAAGKCPIVCTLSFAWSPWGTGSAEALQSLKDSLCVNLYDRTANGLPTMTLQLHAQTKSLLTAEEKAAITAKGYTIT